MRKSTTRTITWLDTYGLYREAGINQYLTQEQLDGNSEFVIAAQGDVTSAADAKRQENIAATQYVGDALMGVGLTVMAAASESVVGLVVGALVAAVGAILSFFAEWFNPECDKYHCQGYDRNTNTKKKVYRAHIRGLVGAYLPDAREVTAGGDCSCSYTRGPRGMHKCTFVRYMHDGLVMRGEDWGQVAARPSDSGEVRGVNAGIRKGGTKNCTRHWYNKENAVPLRPDGRPIKAGSEKNPWENPEDTYYFRAWRVYKVLRWMQGRDDTYSNILCRTMECMEEVLQNTSSAGGDSSFNQKRRRGSRWYASIVWMMRDIWEAGQKLGWKKFGEVLDQAGCGKRTAQNFQDMASGKKYDPKELPFPWWPLFKSIPFERMIEILIVLKDYFPYEYRRLPIGPEPVGENARAQSAVLKPMLTPIREPIIFSVDMQPIPTKLGWLGPSWWVVGLGVGAAAVGGYALYKVLAPEDDE